MDGEVSLFSLGSFVRWRVPGGGMGGVWRSLVLWLRMACFADESTCRYGRDPNMTIDFAPDIWVDYC